MSSRDGEKTGVEVKETESHMDRRLPWDDKEVRLVVSGSKHIKQALDRLRPLHLQISPMQWAKQLRASTLKAALCSHAQRHAGFSRNEDPKPFCDRLQWNALYVAKHTWFIYLWHSVCSFSKQNANRLNVASLLMVTRLQGSAAFYLSILNSNMLNLEICFF